MKRLIRKASHDYQDRDEAILIVNDKVYSGSTHAECVNEYNENKGASAFERRPDVNSDNGFQNEDKIAFAHLVEDEGAIYVENSSLINMTQNEAASILKKNYPNYSIYDDDSYKNDMSAGEKEDYKLLVAQIKKN